MFIFMVFRIYISIYLIRVSLRYLGACSSALNVDAITVDVVHIGCMSHRVVSGTKRRHEDTVGNR